jgi:DUF4097 and DUF4098 domain-containing protein YvlB
MTARTDRRIALIVGGLLALVFTACSAVQVVGWTIGSVEHTNRQTIPGPIAELRVDAGSGDITIVPALGDDVTVVSRSRGALDTPRVRASIDGANVNVSGGCGGISFGHCSSSIVLHVPAGTDVEVNSSSGDIAASGMAGTISLITGSGDVSGSGLTGDADLQTSSGDVYARGLDGARVRLESASGDVEASDLRAATVRAHTASGDVELAFMEAPGDVDAETASGDVRVTLPRGARDPYRVDVETSSGDREIGIAIDADAPRLIRAHTESGDAVVRYGN